MICSNLTVGILVAVSVLVTDCAYGLRQTAADYGRRSTVLSVEVPPGDETAVKAKFGEETAVKDKFASLMQAPIMELKAKFPPLKPPTVQRSESTETTVQSPVTRRPDLHPKPLKPPPVQRSETTETAFEHSDLKRNMMAELLARHPTLNPRTVQRSAPKPPPVQRSAVEPPTVQRSESTETTVQRPVAKPRTARRPAVEPATVQRSESAETNLHPKLMEELLTITAHPRKPTVKPPQTTETTVQRPALKPFTVQRPALKNPSVERFETTETTESRPAVLSVETAETPVEPRAVQRSDEETAIKAKFALMPKLKKLIKAVVKQWKSAETAIKEPMSITLNKIDETMKKRALKRKIKNHLLKIDHKPVVLIVDDLNKTIDKYKKKGIELSKAEYETIFLLIPPIKKWFDLHNFYKLNGEHNRFDARQAIPDGLESLYEQLTEKAFCRKAV